MDAIETLDGRRLLLRHEEVARSLAIGRTAVFELIRTGQLRVGEDREVAPHSR